MATATHEANGKKPTEDASDLCEAAVYYAELGYAVFPCMPGGKNPATATGFKEATTDVEQVRQWWSRNPNYNIGIATGDLFVLDLDPGNTWMQDDLDRLAELANGGPIARTPRGGWHYFYREPEGHHWGSSISKLAANVDTRGRGGYVVAVPSRRITDSGTLHYHWSPDFELTTSVDELPEPPEWLIGQLDELEASRGHRGNQDATNSKEVESIGEGQRNATLASLAGSMRYRGLSPSVIETALLAANRENCKPPLPDEEVRKIAQSVGRYDTGPQWATDAVPRFAPPEPEELTEDDSEYHQDPGPIPDELLHVPGFVSDVATFCMETAYYPNPVLAFCGAFTLQAFLAGRKIRNEGDMRTNVYLLGLASSASGKDHPRKLNIRIAREVGLLNCIGDSFASGEGLEDAMEATPCMLFQTDEFDTLLHSINKSKEGRHEVMIANLLKFYSSSSSTYQMRRKAGLEGADIHEPCLCIFGTAIPKFYYAAFSERLLTNGLLPRMIVLESGERPRSQEAVFRELPDSIVEVAQWWADFNKPHGAQPANLFPKPISIPFDQEARELTRQHNIACDDEYIRAQRRGDEISMAIWGRASENARKLALIYTASLFGAEVPTAIIPEAVEWATRFIDHQVRRMLYMVQLHVADNPFQADCLKILLRLKDAGGKLTSSVLMRKTGFDKKRLETLIETLIFRGEVTVYTKESDGGRPPKFYELTNLGKARV